MTYAEMLLAFRQQVSDEVTPYMWSDSEVSIFLNDAEREACVRANLLIEESVSTYCTIPVVIGTATYTLSSFVLDVLTAKVDGVKLTRITREDLDRDITGWETATGTPKYFYIVAGKIRLVPNPTATGSLTMVVSRMPIAMASGGPEIHAMYHMRLLDWCKYLAYTKRDAETQDDTKAKIYADRFAASFGEYVGSITHMRFAQRRKTVVDNETLKLGS